MLNQLKRVYNKKMDKNLEAFQGLVQLDREERNLKAKQNYYRAYVLSIILPPIGIYYFVKYLFFGNGGDDVKAGVYSLVLTILSFVISLWLFDLFFKQAMSSTSPNSQFYKDILTPVNQKSFKDLLQ